MNRTTVIASFIGAFLGALLGMAVWALIASIWA